MLQLGQVRKTAPGVQPELQTIISEKGKIRQVAEKKKTFGNMNATGRVTTRENFFWRSLEKKSAKIRDENADYCAVSEKKPGFCIPWKVYKWSTRKKSISDEKKTRARKNPAGKGRVVGRMWSTLTFLKSRVKNSGFRFLRARVF